MVYTQSFCKPFSKNACSLPLSLLLYLSHNTPPHFRLSHLKILRPLISLTRQALPPSTALVSLTRQTTLLPSSLSNNKTPLDLSHNKPINAWARARISDEARRYEARRGVAWRGEVRSGTTWWGEAHELRFLDLLLLLFLPDLRFGFDFCQFWVAGDGCRCAGGLELMGSSWFWAWFFGFV